MSKRSLECLRKIYYLHLKTYNNVKMKLHKKTKGGNGQMDICNSRVATANPV